ncbi:MAG: NAD-dependent dehydratase [Waddliaceae bacterium]|nr:NAD-dependent dehydratase [Waddliaceae bacterium]
MRVLVTGHNGYIGCVLAPMLKEHGCDVVGLDTDFYRTCTYGKNPSIFPEIVKDIRNVRVEDLKGFEAVIHLAALSNDPLSDLDPPLTYELNHEATIHLAKMAKAAGVRRFIFSSSCSNYGAAGEDWLTEESNLNPITPYGHSKVLSEKDLQKLACDTFHPTYMRSATAYGYSPRLRFDLVLNNLTAWAYTTGNIHLKSKGNSWRPIVHIEDISRAFTAALTAPIELIHNEAFNVGITEENFQVRDIAQIVQLNMPDCQITFSADAQEDKRSYRVDFTKIHRALPNYQPQWTAYKGVGELLDSFKEYGLELNEFEGPRYRRVSHIKKLIKQDSIDSKLYWTQKEMQKS